MSHIQQITLDLIPNGEMPILYASQYDAGRSFRANIVERKIPYTLDGTELISLTVRKGDGNLVTMDIANTFANKSYIDFLSTEQMTAIAGSNFGELHLESNGESIGTLNFYLLVEPAADEGGITSQSEINNLKRQVHDAVVEELEENGAEETGYDNTESGLTATNVQDAIDEVNEKVNEKVDASSLAEVATSGSYNDLLDKPSIPAAQVNSDWNADSGVSQILNKPNLSKVATTGDYNDLDNKPSVAVIDDTQASANKVYSSNKVDSLLEPLNNMEIEGYAKNQYKDITSNAVLNIGKYAEMSGGYIQISNSPNYKYAVIDIVEGKTYQTTGVNVYDMRPMTFTDDDGRILAYLPTQRKTTAEYVTVEAVVPTGATKLYVNGRSSDEIVIKEKGNFYLIDEDVGVGIDVSINKESVLDTTIITHRGGDILQRIEVFNNDGQPNNAVLPRSVEVFIDNAWKTIVNNEDDNCPVQLMSGYIGAGHGYSRAQKFTLENHGKTYADIGSKWQSNGTYTRYWYIINIIDENNFIMLGNDDTSNGYDTTAWAGGTELNHIEGAVHTEAITGFTRANYVLSPIDKNHIKKVMLDGVIEANENGDYKANSYVDIVEEYDLINPQGIVPSIISNKPVGGYTENPEINTGDVFLYFSNIYRILNDGTMLLFSLLDNNVQVDISYWGATQYAQKTSATVFNGGLFRYVPKLLEVDGHDLRIPFNMSSWNFTIEATTEYWEDADNPPDRLLHLYTDNLGKYKAGFSVGYLPIANGKGDNRKSNISNAMTLYSTKKAYPHIVDRVGLHYNQWSAYTPFQCVAFRKPVLDVANIHTDAYFIPYGEKCYLYADYHAISDDRIKVPSEYVGKPITVIEKSSNVTVYGTIATDEIRIRVDTSSPMYGYAVIQIG